MERLTKRTETGVAYLVEPLMLNSDNETRGRVHSLVDALAHYEDEREKNGGIDYKEAYEESCKVVDSLTESYEEAQKKIKEKDDTIKMAMDMHDTDRKLLAKYRDDIAKLTFGLRVVEALTDHDILEDF